MEITTSFQGREKCNELKARLSKLSYNPDLRKVLHNIEIMVSEISKIEVICRQTKNNSRGRKLVSTSMAIHNTSAYASY